MSLYLLTFIGVLSRCGGLILDGPNTASSHGNTSVHVYGTTTVPCIDDGDLNCAVAQEDLNVCSDIDHAKVFCRKYCNLCNLVDGSWTEWSPWSRCSISCGDSQLTRSRACTNPAPANLGSNCTGPDHEHKLCSLDPCPVHGGWSPWGSWGTCSVSCGVGIQRRDRTCSNPPPQYFGDHCFGDSIDNQLCFPGHCADGGWSTWSVWGSCSKTCGIGTRTRQRLCNNPAPSLLGTFCQGTPIQSDTCGTATGCFVRTNVSCCVEYAIYQRDSTNAYKVRLCDGNGQNRCNSSRGRVEVAQLSTLEWGSVCDDAWDSNNNASNVFCRSIGYRSGSNIHPRIAGPSWLPIHLDDVTCAGTETNIFRCQHLSWNSNNCGHGEDASVLCS